MVYQPCNAADDGEGYQYAYNAIESVRLANVFFHVGITLQAV